MKGANRLFIFTGVALALVAVLLGITMSGADKVPAQDEGDEKPEKISVVKAAVDFEPHTVISMSDVVIEEMDSDEAPPDAATDLALVLNQSYKLGAVKGDIILTSYLQPPGIRNSIEAGKRAFSLEVDNKGMMAGLVMDGDYVDIVFQGRVDLRRVLQAGAVEVEEDGPYNITGIAPDQDAGDAQQYQGADGSEFTVADGGQNLEPVVKMLIQDVKIIRVVAPGVQYDAQGQQIQASADTGVAAEDMGQLIVEVTPQQAEALAFIQDQNHSFEVVVRGADDHEVVSTTGITFQILMTDGTWSLPWPQPVVAPGGEGSSTEETQDSDS
jgi:Flp pilus assembly protein CpaB